MNHIKLTHEPLDVGALNALAADESCGAISIFVGTTRNNFDGKRVISLSYEAYEAMALKELQSICDKIRKQWSDIVTIVIYHRLGLVPVKEASVVICVSSPHRQSSLDALSFAIDDLKKHVPIWKKEIYEDKSEWKENKESTAFRAKHIKTNLTETVTCAIPPSNLVQIKATQEELDHRIESFLKSKRADINRNNIADFTTIDSSSTEANTCARVNTFIEKQAQSKCHLKVRRVKNDCGPQIKNDYIQTLDKLMSNTEPLDSSIFIKQENDISSSGRSSNKWNSIQERLALIEEELEMPHTDKQNVFRRLKLIEERILKLEAISPEYKHFLPGVSSQRKKTKLIHNDESHSVNLHKKTKNYTLNDIDQMIEKYSK